MNLQRKIMTWKERLVILTLLVYLVFLLSYPFLKEPTTHENGSFNAKERRERPIKRMGQDNVVAPS